MKMNKNKLWITVAIVTLLVIASVWFFAFFSIKKENPSSRSKTTSASSESSGSVSTLATLKGKAFDEAYIAGMLAHHEGAVNMAEQAQAATGRDEIREFAGIIVSAQSQEIMQMKEWQKDWGYEVTMSGGHMSHSGAGMEMSGDMVEMMNKLEGLSGEAYDKEFLTQMTIHHQQAVEMSKYAEANAQHSEVKQLARSIIAAQAAEINQMKQWQKQWGYTQ